MADKFIPALRFKGLTPLFDLFLRLTLPERALKKSLLAKANLTSEQQILDLGCGTGTLTILIKQAVIKAKVCGVDIDPNVLKLAHQKIQEAGLDIPLEQANASTLPYPSNRFERVLSSLVLHHLTLTEKHQAFKEVLRVLQPDGEFWILDFGEPHNGIMFLISLIFRWFEETKGHIAGKLPGLLVEAGFSEVNVVENFNTVFGTLSIFKARK